MLTAKQNMSKDSKRCCTYTVIHTRKHIANDAEYAAVAFGCGILFWFAAVPHKMHEKYQQQQPKKGMTNAPRKRLLNAISCIVPCTCVCVSKCMQHHVIRDATVFSSVVWFAKDS